MYVCNCNGLNERMVDDAIAGGAQSLEEVFERNDCVARCGLCAPEILERLERAQGSEHPSPEARESTAVP